jgi:hypothetical protein
LPTITNNRTYINSRYGVRVNSIRDEHAFWLLMTFEAHTSSSLDSVSFGPPYFGSVFGSDSDSIKSPYSSRNKIRSRIGGRVKKRNITAHGAYGTHRRHEHDSGPSIITESHHSFPPISVPLNMRQKTSPQLILILTQISITEQEGKEQIRNSFLCKNSHNWSRNWSWFPSLSTLNKGCSVEWSTLIPNSGLTSTSRKEGSEEPIANYCKILQN